MTKEVMMQKIVDARGLESVWTIRFCILCEQGFVSEPMLEEFYLPHMLEAKEPEF